MKHYVSFPRMGNYHIPAECFIKLILNDCKVKASPPITKRTLELGSKYSPDFVCVPFKYNLGNYIEALEDGANILIQMGGGCRYGYYGEIQEQILRDLGYKFQFINLFASENFSIHFLYKKFKNLGCRLSFYKFVYYFFMIMKMIKIMDKIESYIRENIGFEVYENSFDKLHNEFLEKLKTVKSIKGLNHVYKEYMDKFQTIEIKKPKNMLKVGIVGELYTLMEPFCNFYLERELAKNKIMVTRNITVTFLLLEKHRKRKAILKNAGNYLKYELGADGTDSVSDSKMLAEKGYDGIIHVKPFGCTPEVNAMPMLQNIGKDYKIPILYFSLDSQTSETGIKTRLEAFHDMIVMRKEKTG